MMTSNKLTFGILLCIAHISVGTGKEAEITSRSKRSLVGKQLKIVVIQEEPYTFKKDGSFEGFIPDLIETLSRNLKFQYDMYEVPDGRYGMMDKNGNWNGMIKEVLDGRADIAGSAITITSMRLNVINYIKPFQHTGLAVVVKKPHMEDDFQSPVFFQVLEPFSAGVWGFTTGGLCLVGLLLWLMNLKNPYEWKSQYEMGKASETQGQLFDLPGSLWFAFSTLQWQGYEQAPRSIAARVLSCSWFAFVTLTLVTYTGSLMNYLFWASSIQARSGDGAPFHSLEEMILNKDYSYGCVAGGSTFRFITENKNIMEYQRMAQYFKKTGADALVRSVAEGIEKARNGKFAFVMEDMSALHHINQAPCDLMIAGEKFAPSYYGMVVSKQMPQEISDALNQGIMELHEMGEIEALEKKWWVDRGECWNITKEDSKATAGKYVLNKPKKVSMREFWGPLTLLLVGIVLSILIAVAEIFYYRQRGRYQGPGRAPLKSVNSVEG